MSIEMSAIISRSQGSVRNPEPERAPAIEELGVLFCHYALSPAALSNDNEVSESCCGEDCTSEQEAATPCDMTELIDALLTQEEETACETVLPEGGNVIPAPETPLQRDDIENTQFSNQAAVGTPLASALLPSERLASGHDRINGQLIDVEKDLARPNPKRALDITGAQHTVLNKIPSSLSHKIHEVQAQRTSGLYAGSPNFERDQISGKGNSRLLTTKNEPDLGLLRTDGAGSSHPALIRPGSSVFSGTPIVAALKNAHSEEGANFDRTIVSQALDRTGFNGTFEASRTLSSSSIPVPTAPASAQPAVPQIAGALAQMIGSKVNGVTEIQLSPEELGRIRMYVSTQEHGSSLMISAERPETGEYLRRNLDMLEKACRDFGLEGANISYGDQRSDEQHGAETAENHSAAGLESFVDDPAIPMRTAIVNLDRLDLRL